MEIRRIGENQIRCALTEAEIQEMGFDIDDIIRNTETTQQFMHIVLQMVEEQEDIDLEEISPMVKAELLQDHSMRITIGGDSDMTFKGLVDTVNQLLGQMSPESIEEFALMSREEKQAAVDKFLEEMRQKAADASANPKKLEKKTKKKDALVCALKFESMETMIQMSKVCFSERFPMSSLYKMQDSYYLVLDFLGFAKEEMRPFTLGVAEYDNGRFSDDARIAYIKEHGTCLVKNEALQTLMAL